MILLGGLAFAQVHLERLPLPDDLEPIAITWHEQLYVLGSDSSIRSWDGERWQEVTRVPDDGTAPYKLFAAPDGALWVTGWRPAKTRRFDGAWGPWEPVGALHGAFVAFGEDTAWSGGHQQVFRHDGAGWRPAHEEPFSQAAVQDCEADGAGAICAINDGRLVRVEDELSFLDPPPAQLDHLTRDEDGRLVGAGAKGAWRREADGTWTSLSEAYSTASCSSAGCWLSYGEELVWYRDETVERAWSGVGASGVVDREGTLYALREGSVLTTRPGPGPALRRISAEVGLGDLGRQPVTGVADLDGDGLEDLLVWIASEQRAFYQRGRTLVDETDEHRLEISEAGNTMACDLDDNGLPDILGLRKSGENVYQRNLGTHFVDAGPRGGFRTPDPYRQGGGFGHCVDLDGDGDQDVVWTIPFQRLELPRSVMAWENVGQGRLVWLDLAHRGLSVRGYARALRFADLDADGHQDVFVGAMWGTGHELLRGTDEGLEDATEGSGLVGSYPELTDAWLDDVDDDGLLDVLTADLDHGPRAWRNQGGLRFEPSSHAWGLDAAIGQRMRSSLYADLDADGHEDLLTCDVGDCMLLQGTPEGFRELSAALPAVSEGVYQTQGIDLGGDGDTDVLLLGVGVEQVFENLADELTSSATTATPVERPFGVERRLAWSTGWDRAALLAGLGLWAAVAFGVRRGGSRLVLGGWGAPLVLSGLATGWLAALELTWGLRLGLGVTAAALALPAGFGEHLTHRYRSARRVAGHRLLSRLGEGGMGTVYKAVEAGTGELVALKLVRPELLARPRDLEMFRREATIATEVRDPRLVELRSFGETTVIQDGRPVPTAYLVMELLRGATLSSVLAARGRLPFSEACGTVLEVAEALAALHDRDVVHRDVKPDNIMVGPDGSVKLMDLGAAKHVDGRTRNAGHVLGTLGYLPPEQADRRRPPDLRSDVYACGVVLYELLTGHRPFDEPDLMGMMAAILDNQVPPMDPALGVPSEVEGIARKALRGDPDERFQNTHELAGALEPWAAAVSSATESALAEPVVTAPHQQSLPVWWEVLRAYPTFLVGAGRKDLADFAVMLLRRAAARGDDVTEMTEELQEVLGTSETAPLAPATWVDE